MSRFMIDGMSLYKYCESRGLNYQTTRYRLLNVLGITVHKRGPKLTREETNRRVKIKLRIKKGWSEEEANLPDDEFRRLSALKKGKYKIGRYNLYYVCYKLNLKYDTIYHALTRHPECTAESYLKSLGYNLEEFMK